jgi:hypothetical protein
MYGENDWMDIAGGYAAEQKIKEEKEKTLKNATEEEKKAEEEEMIDAKRHSSNVNPFWSRS